MLPFVLLIYITLYWCGSYVLLYKAMKQRMNTFPSSPKKKQKQRVASSSSLMATRIMYLTAAVFLALVIISTTEAGGGCKHSSFFFQFYFITCCAGSRGRCSPPSPPRPSPPPPSFRCFEIRRDEPACRRPRDCESLCAKNDFPTERAYCRSRRECCCMHPAL